MKARKLYSPHILAKAIQLRSIGVPTRRIRRDMSITISVPTFNALVDNYDDMVKYNTLSPTVSKVIRSSLFPLWLVNDLPAAQEQPPNWKYIGKFPLGAWQEQTA